ncbi:MAG: aldo/keto reductase, partial [Armatimonadetes bacterium]|nr:aldo/keto reductase [Armatimonadota bacterium]
HGMAHEARRIVHRAIDLGINYFDAARVYKDCEGYLGGALRGKREQVFLASKSAQRSRDGARADLDETLRALRTDRLDLWEIHDLRTLEELDQITAPDGALAAFDEARRAGKVRFIGITAHHDPLVLHRALSQFQYDTCMVPVNLAEPHYRPFLDIVLPVGREGDVGLIGMKALCGGLIGSPEYPIMYALSQPVSTLLLGVNDLEQLEENVKIAARFERLSEEDVAELLEASRPHAMRLLYYKKKQEFVFSLN